MRSRGVGLHRVGIESLETRRLLSISVVAKKLALTVVGTSGDDVITVAASRNLINVIDVSIKSAGGTEQRLVSLGQFKTIGISAGAGNDTIRIESTLSGLTGDVGVWIDAGAGDDNLATCSLGGLIKLGAGNDLATLSATDRVYVSGETGNDKITLPTGTHWADGGAGNDTIVAGNGKQIVNGGSGNDELIASSTSGTINGDAGDDHVTLSDVGAYNYDAITTVFGGDGNDRLEGDTSGEMHGGAGDDILISGTRSSKLFGNEGNDVLDARASYGTTLHGNQGDDDLYGKNYTAAYGDKGADWFEPDVIFSPNDFDPKEDRKRGGAPNTPSYGGSSSGAVVTVDGTSLNFSAAVLSRLDDVGFVVNRGTANEKKRILSYGVNRPSRPTLTKEERKGVANGIVRLPAGWALSNTKTVAGFVWYDVSYGKGGDRANSTEFSTVYALAVKQGTVVVTQDGGYVKGAQRIGRGRADIAALWLPAGGTARIAGSESTTYTVAGEAPTGVIKAPAKQRGIAVEGGVIWLPFEDRTTRYVVLS